MCLPQTCVFKYKLYTEEKKLADEFCVYIGWLFASAVTNARVYGAGTAAEETFSFNNSYC